MPPTYADYERDGFPPLGTDERDQIEAEQARAVAGLLRQAKPLPAHILPASHPGHRYPEHCLCRGCKSHRTTPG